MKAWLYSLKSHRLGFAIGGIVSVLVGITVMGFATQASEENLDYLNVEEDILEIEVGEDYPLAYDSSLATPFLTWESSDLSKAKVVGGVIESLAPGDVTISVHARNGALRDDVKLTIKPAPFEVRIGDETYTLLTPVSTEELIIEIPENMHFDGLFIDAALSQPYLDSTVDSDMTLYPKFTPISPVIEMIAVEWVRPDETVKTLIVEKGTTLETLIQELNINNPLVMMNDDACPNILTGEFVVNEPVRFTSWTDDNLPCAITASSFIIEGNMTVGQTINVKAVDPKITFSLAWEGLDRSVSSDTLELIEGDEGKMLFVNIQGTGEYSGDVTLSLGLVESVTPDEEDSNTPENESPEIITPPASDSIPLAELVILGEFKVGETIQAYISPSAATVTYQWFISENNREFVTIPNATGSAYTITPNDHRQYLAVNVQGIGEYTGLLKQGTPRVKLNQNVVTPSEEPERTVLTINSNTYIPIADAEDLQAINSTASYVFASGTPYELLTQGGINKRYALINDVDLSQANWTEIHTFSGILDGQNHTIKNLTHINDEGSLFNTLDGAIIQNITISTFGVSGTSVGILARFATGAKTHIENMVVTHSFLSASLHAGGLIAKVDYTTLSIDPPVSTALGQVTESGLQIHDVQLHAEIESANSDGTSDASAGGLIGYVMGSQHDISINQVNIFDSVTSTDYVGGAIGMIVNVDATVNLTRVVNHAFINQRENYALAAGGLIGFIASGSGEVTGSLNISQSANQGEMSSASIAGGLIGQVVSLHDIRINESYTHTKILSTHNGDIGEDESIYVGGIIGYLTNLGVFEIKDSYSLNTLLLNEHIDSEDVGGLVGAFFGDTLTQSSIIQNTYAFNVFDAPDPITTSALFGKLKDGNNLLNLDHVFYTSDFQDFATSNDDSTLITGGVIETLFDLDEYVNFDISDEKAHVSEIWKINTQEASTLPYLAWQETPLQYQERAWYFIHYREYIPVASVDDLSLMLSDESRAFAEGTEYESTVIEPAGRFRENYILVNDIDLTSENSWNPIGTSQTALSGIFDGNGHTIKNMTITQAPTEDDGYGLFSRLEDATIKNLKLEDAGVGLNQTNTGILAGIATFDTHIQGVVITNAHINSLGNNLGGLIGLVTSGTLTVQQTTVDVEIFSLELTQYPSSSGGLIGYLHLSDLQLSEIEVNSTINSNGFNVGGVIGEVNGDGHHLTVQAISVDTDIDAGDYIGGFIGELTDQEIYINSINLAVDIDGGDGLGGFIGELISANRSSILTGSGIEVSGFITSDEDDVGVIIGQIIDTTIGDSNIFNINLNQITNSSNLSDNATALIGNSNGYNYSDGTLEYPGSS